MTSIYDAELLLVDDNPDLLRLLCEQLSGAGYHHIRTAATCAAARAVFDAAPPHLMVLDINLPDGDGFSLFRALRARADVPALFLSARDADADRLFGLGLGADDYLTKPFAIEELLARMRVAFKHSEGSNIAKKTILQVQNLEIDTEKRMVTVDGKVVDLTKKEYELLTYLVQNKNIVLTREQILNEVWGYSYIGETNVVDVYIRYLRAKIDEAFGKKYILTIRGVGYYVKEE